MQLHFSYAIYAHGPILLMCQQYLNGQPPTLWRFFWTSKESAVEVAESMCADAEEYIDDLRLVIRPYEDLGIDEFLQHLHMRINNELH